MYRPSPKKQGFGESDTGFLLQAKDLPTFKDNDFLNEGQKLHVGEESKKNFLEKLKRDVEVEFPEGWLVTVSHNWVLTVASVVAAKVAIPGSVKQIQSRIC